MITSMRSRRRTASIGSSFYFRVLNGRLLASGKNHLPQRPNLAFDEVQKNLDHSLRHLIDEDVSEDRRLIEQRVRLYLTENVDGNILGRTEELSEEVLQALREVKLQAAPNLQVASITARPLELSSPGKRLSSVSQRSCPPSARIGL